MSRARTLFSCAYALVSALACAGLVAAATLAPAPAGAIPVIALAVVAVPMLAAWHLATEVPAIRSRHHIAQLRKALAALPEAEHPLGF